MAERRLVDVVREVVAKVHPEELADFDLIVEVWNDDPRALRLARRSRDEPTASGWQSAAEFFGSLALEVGVGICVGLITSGVVTTARKGLRLVRRRRSPEVGPEMVVPPIDEKDVPALEAEMRTKALALGASDADADELARRLAASWPRK